MKLKPKITIADHFGEMEDPRVEWNIQHKLIGSAKQVMMHCSNGQNTKLHQCDSLMTWKKTMFFAPNERVVV